MDYKYCSSCGQQIIATSRFCHNCGARFQPQNVERVQAPASGQVPIYHHLKPLDEQEEYLWIYTNSEKYIEKWRKKSKWNWPAFLFGPFWMGYRKMYAEAALYFVGFLLLNIIQLLIGAPDRFYGLYTAVNFSIAVSSNSIYYRKAKKSIENIVLLHGEREVRHSLIRKKGGTSGWGIVYALLIGLITAFIIGSIEDALPQSTTSTPVISNVSTTVKALVFAENVDENSDRLTAIHPGTVFNRGEISVIFDNGSKEIAVDSLTTTVMRINDGSEQLVDRFSSTLDPEWVRVVITYTFTEKGQYRVTIEKPSGELIGDGRVDIK